MLLADKNNVKVVTKLRLIFALVVALLALSAIVSGYLLVQLKDSQTNSINNSVPTLSYAHEMANQMVAISDLTVRLEDVSNPVDVQKIYTVLDEKQAALRKIVQELLEEADQYDVDAAQLEYAAIYVNTSVQTVVDAKIKMIEVEDVIHTKMAQVESIRQVFVGQFEPMSLAYSTKVSDSLDAVYNSSNASEVAQSNLTNNFNNQRRLQEFAFGIYALLDLIESAPISSGAEYSEALEKEVQSKFKRSTLILADFDGSGGSRRAWAKILSGLRQLTLGESGLFENIRTVHLLEAQFNETHTSQLNEIKILSDSINTIVETIQEEVKASTSEFNKILSTIIASLIILGVGVVLVIMLANYLVVERQINNRMHKLTSAVLDIAGGKHDREVDVKGQDEIGKMAASLEVFKMNAIELQRSNTELEQFAYAASHDLKSPLRAIESLATWTLEDAGDDLAPDAKSNLEQLLVRANRLSRLQTDLLNYSRAGSPDDSVSHVDFTRMVEDVSEMLDPDHHFKIYLGRAPSGLATQIVPLRQIIINLVTNALKHHDRDKGQIEINVDIKGNRLELSVSDDGPGIATEYHERIFGLFEKLESRDKVEGSGLGLSLVKKMVERCKGSIKVLSDPSKERGSTFVFDWPYTELSVNELIKEPEKKVSGF